ncbi:hypothetical protein Tco_0962424 [Tanacetum coccineum]
MPIALLDLQDPMIKCFETTFQKTRPHGLQMGKSGANGNFKSQLNSDVPSFRAFLIATTSIHDLEEEPAPTGETSAPPAPKTAKQLVAKRNQERVKSILLLAIPDEYLLKFHNVADAKSL